MTSLASLPLPPLLLHRLQHRSSFSWDVKFPQPLGCSGLETVRSGTGPGCALRRRTNTGPGAVKHTTTISTMIIFTVFPKMLDFLFRVITIYHPARTKQVLPTLQRVLAGRTNLNPPCKLVTPLWRGLGCKAAANPHL